MNITPDTSDSCDGKCHICGGTATAFWDGAVQRIEVCASCATTKIVQLVVDSLPRFDMESAMSFNERLNSAFWRGVAFRLQRERPEDEKGAPVDLRD